MVLTKRVTLLTLDGLDNQKSKCRFQRGTSLVEERMPLLRRCWKDDEKPAKKTNRERPESWEET